MTLTDGKRVTVTAAEGQSFNMKNDQITSTSPLTVRVNDREIKGLGNSFSIAELVSRSQQQSSTIGR